jgi:sulfoxide reductase heme-binding subunit YedZ
MSLAVAGGSAAWYLARGTGVVSLLLLTLVIVLGLAGPLRVSLGERFPRFAIDTLHRDLSLLAVALLAVHIITSVLDRFAPIRLLDAVLPFASSYRPLWLGLGALAFDIILALVVTSLVRRQLGYGSWRMIHWLAYLCWPVAVLHGLGTGTDVKAAWMLIITALCVGLVTAAIAVRVARAATPAGARGWLLGLTAASVLGGVVFTLQGPLKPHWARRAGTPATLLGAPRRHG